MGKIIRQGAVETLYEMPLKVNWGITTMCNYACEYCYGQNPIDKNKFTTREQLKKAVEHIAKSNRTKYEFTLVGGEPTVHPEFWYLMDELYSQLGERIESVFIITNGSKSSEWFSNLKKYLDKMHIRVVISIHLQYAKFEHIEKIIKDLSGDIGITLNLMLEIDRFEDVKTFFYKALELRKLYSFNLSINLLREAPNFDAVDSRYTNEILEWRDDASKIFRKVVDDESKKLPIAYDRATFTIFEEIENLDSTTFNTDYDRNKWLIEGKLNCKGMKCISGASILKIGPNGECKGMVCTATKKQSNIFECNPFLEEDWIHIVECPYRNCGCNVNHIIPKFESEIEAELFLEIVRSKQEKMLDANKKN
ncbi:radical SAM protein [Pseudobutyrivibrio xylanivorans]|uniref:4Fe-4S single cluster domain-containing protein n=1 Tax=Pseudobutyrivibrio xylanivorans DSM 14809 TaxID=1123012 RepID=A0A1M6D8Q0_PSEXY|nr:radical SAM protein [Pseudobutyrivibrio xylanivorans]SHI69617.1 4Fe-4S single cluster domain-containing protein [Pseudobutyrivibrio xylanivorans DSM 14809]